MTELKPEKVRPEKLENFHGQDGKTRRIIGRVVETGELNADLLLHGPKGTGKTTAAEMMAKALVEHEMHWDRIDCSKRNSPKAIVNTINNILETASMDTDEQRVLVLDQVDQLRSDFHEGIQQAVDSRQRVIATAKNPDSLEVSIGAELEFELLSQEEVKKILQDINQHRKLGITSEKIQDIAEMSDGEARRPIQELGLETG
ncbi:AAA family ATPase [Candidatus Nanohalobium constans]|uniref:Replication factor C small subunit n=1 Tax=Candidatus Nanohalobium constans TaxID=2565781 RepID=A0A5Q0UJ72_9ARCH|nr:AAA family ATPase [Candidatus Nanohalobium constans]QGA80879.1 replication factor C small subunit [Candidatus Nanohalobium constans]